MKKFLLLLSLLFLFGTRDVSALEYIGNDDVICTETEAYKKWTKLSEKEKANVIQPVKCQEALTSMSKVKVTRVRGTLTLLLLLLL